MVQIYLSVYLSNSYYPVTFSTTASVLSPLNYWKKLAVVFYMHTLHFVVNGTNISQYIPFQQLLSSLVQYNCLSIKSSKLLEEAVKESSYPPSITCAVRYNEELRKIGNPTEVELEIEGMDPKMEFQCKAYERVQGD